MEAMEAMLTLALAPAPAGGPESESVVGLRACGQIEDGPGERARARRAAGGQWKGDIGGGGGSDADVDVGVGASGWSKVEVGRRAEGGQLQGGVGEIWDDDEHARLDGESGGGSDEEKDSTDGGEKWREDETRSEERRYGQGYD